MGFVGVHAASDHVFHTLPDPEDRSNRYNRAMEIRKDAILADALGAEFITHGREPRLQGRRI